MCLARKPWQVFTREVLLEQVWGYRHAADTRLVNVHVQRLRSKVEHDPENPEIVVTVRGVGYKAGTGVAVAAARDGSGARSCAGPSTVWRRSIQARVVISTLLLSARRGLPGRLGAAPADHRRPGASARPTSSVAEATRATAEAQSRLSAAERQRLRRQHPAHPAGRARSSRAAPSRATTSC